MTLIKDNSSGKILQKEKLETNCREATVLYNIFLVYGTKTKCDIKEFNHDNDLVLAS